MVDFKKSVDYIMSVTGSYSDIAVISGSNSIDISSKFKNIKKIAYNQIPNFPTSTVDGHEGGMFFAQSEDKKVLFLRGRFHYYEGYNMKDVTYYVRVLSLLGVKTIIITNAAGAVNPSFRPGDIMMIKDHVSMFLPECPLRGKNMGDFGERFPDMTEVYNKELRKKSEKIAQRLNIKLRNGVYAYLQGPRYETPSEIKLLELLKVDAVGMSTVPEAIVARHCNMKVLGFSCITNMAAGISDKDLSHNEVIEVGKKNKDIMSSFIHELVGIAKE